MEPLSIDRSVRRLPDVTSRSGRTFAVYSGEHQFYVAQLQRLSAQEHIQTYTPRDGMERFRDLVATERWLRKDPKELYYLLDPETPGQVRGIIWHSARPKEYCGVTYPYSFAVRVYEGAVGEGIAKPFMKAALQDLVAQNPDAQQGIWLDTGIDNETAQYVYKSFGYEEVQRDNNRVHMVLSPERIQEILSEAPDLGD